MSGLRYATLSPCAVAMIDMATARLSLTNESVTGVSNEDDVENEGMLATHSGDVIGGGSIDDGASRELGKQGLSERQHSCSTARTACRASYAVGATSCSSMRCRCARRGIFAQARTGVKHGATCPLERRGLA